MPKSFNSKTVADRVAARLDLTLLSAVGAGEHAAAFLDERLHKSPLRDGFLALSGELVHLEDLVLHDAEMDLHAPTHELTRAHATPARRSAPPAALKRAAERCSIEVSRQKQPLIYGLT